MTRPAYFARDNVSMCDDKIITVSVQGAFNAELVASIQVYLSSTVGELKTAIAVRVQVPVACQNLLLESSVIPLLNDQTIGSIGLQPNQLFLLVVQAPRHPLKSLCRLLTGCTCGFWEKLNPEKLWTRWQIYPCGCEEPKKSSLSELEVRYLLQELQASDIPPLQGLFERMVLTDRADAVRVLVQDFRIDVNTRDHNGCIHCCVPGRKMALIEEAASLGMEASCRVLLESGRLDITSIPSMEQRILMQQADGSYENVSNHELGLYNTIQWHGWDQDSDFCRTYVEQIDMTCVPFEFVEALNIANSGAGSGGRNEQKSRAIVTSFLIEGVPLQDALTEAMLEGCAIDLADEMVSCKSRQKNTRHAALFIHQEHKLGGKSESAHQRHVEHRRLVRISLEMIRQKEQRDRRSAVKVRKRSRQAFRDEKNDFLAHGA